MEEGQEGDGPPPRRARVRGGRWKRPSGAAGRGRLSAGRRGGGGAGGGGGGGRVGAEHAGGCAPPVQVRGQVLLLALLQGEIEI